MSKPMLCSVYRSERKSDTYLYLAEDSDLSELPEELQRLFTPQVKVMTLKVTSERKFARFTGQELQHELLDKGYYFQVPPPLESLLKTEK